MKKNNFKFILLIMILFITGCESNYQINCSLIETDGDDKYTNTLVGVFENNKLTEIKNNGEAIYNEENNTVLVYNSMKEIFNNMNNDGVKTDLKIEHNKLNYYIEYNFNTITKENIKKNLGYYGRSKYFFKKYAKKQGYFCE